MIIDVGDKLPAVLNTLGLLLDVVGILVLFKFGIDKNRDIREGGTPLLWTEGSESEEELARNNGRYKKYLGYTNLAYALIAVGFLLQAASNWIV